MPYITPYAATLPTLEEARLWAIQAMIVASLSDLNTSLAQTGMPSSMPLSLTSDDVVLGDPETVLRTLICVVGGGNQDAKDMEIEPDYFKPRNDKAGPKETIYTNIYCYIGHNDLLASDPLQYVQYREIALARIRGHLRKRVFNSAQGATINLQSQEHTSGSDFDQLKNCHIRAIYQGKVPKMGGKLEVVWSSHLVHTGWIA